MSTIKTPAVRAAAAAGIAAALLTLPVAATTTRAAAADQPQLRLAQATRPQTAPGAQKAAPASPQSQIEDLKKRLHITAAQEPKFDNFTKVVEENAQRLRKVLAQEQPKAAGNPVERLRAAERVTEAQVDALKRLIPAVEGLYDSFSAEQKRTADQVLFARNTSHRTR
ncbi:MAG TPA: Spy/CpxP family protein refolding chaperone [Stellaceae bacterium]|nr:Spy/CpxP family protein refolding chaperone [Stellaceae bacterium]